MNSHQNIQVCDLSSPLPQELQGGVIAIGNFDGLHRGHQMVLQHTQMLAAGLGVPCLVLSFEPHPKTLFRPDKPVFRLTPLDMKARVLDAIGLNGLAVLPFTKEIAATGAREFVERFLVQHAGAAHVVSGFNFHFGKGREGSPQFLTQTGAEFGFGVTIIDAHEDSSDEVISSSRIRACLADGDVSKASELLGYRWCVGGEVVKGAQLGRTLGFPTANLELPLESELAHGIYAVRMRRSTGTLFNGVASYGRRPTFDNGKALLETFVFDFADDLYGEQIEVSLFKWLRPEEKFDSAETLVEQMNIDSRQAKEYLASVKPLSKLDNELTFEGLVT